MWKTAPTHIGSFSSMGSVVDVEMRFLSEDLVATWTIALELLRLFGVSSGSRSAACFGRGGRTKFERWRGHWLGFGRGGGRQHVILFLCWHIVVLDNHHELVNCRVELDTLNRVLHLICRDDLGCQRLCSNRYQARRRGRDGSFDLSLERLFGLWA